MLSKLTKLINEFYSNWACTYFFARSVLFYNSNMMLCGAYWLTLYGHEHYTPCPTKGLFSLIRRIC